KVLSLDKGMPIHDPMSVWAMGFGHTRAENPRFSASRSTAAPYRGPLSQRTSVTLLRLGTIRPIQEGGRQFVPMPEGRGPLAANLAVAGRGGRIVRRDSVIADRCGGFLDRAQRVGSRGRGLL